MRAFAKVGIIALVDEATGYQDKRAQNALAKILEKFIAEEMQPHTKTFPEEFYRQIFRLRGWEWKPWTVKKPGVIGHYTNDIVYERLAPDVLDELKRPNPTNEAGNRTAPSMVHTRSWPPEAERALGGCDRSDAHRTESGKVPAGAAKSVPQARASGNAQYW